jgi:AraC-like DNA-binding protein
MLDNVFMAYREFGPGKNLQKYIDSYWYSANENYDDIKLPVLPDGCMDIVFPLSGNNQPFVVGTMTKAETVSIRPKQRMFGIRFRPAIAPSFLKVPAIELRDTIVSLESLNKKMVGEMGELNSKQQAKNYIEFFDKKIAKVLHDIDIDERVLYAVDLVAKRQGNVSLDKVAQEAGISLRHIERLFKYHVGISPKRFARIIRFYQSHVALSKSGVLSLATTAYQYGYADQVHFNKDYKIFTGVNPTHQSMSYFYNK